MKFALYLSNFGKFSDVRALAGLAHEAEVGGWDGIFLFDTLSPVFEPGSYLPVADPWLALAAVALATERLRFGTLVTAPARRRPAQVTRETVAAYAEAGVTWWLENATSLDETRDRARTGPPSAN